MRRVEGRQDLRTTHKRHACNTLSAIWSKVGFMLALSFIEVKSSEPSVTIIFHLQHQCVEVVFRNKGGTEQHEVAGVAWQNGIVDNPDTIVKLIAQLKSEYET